MSQNVRASHAPRLPPSGASSGVIGHPSRSSVAGNNSSSNMNHANPSQPASWGHGNNGSNQNAGGAVSNQHGAAPGTPSGADYDKATTVPSPQSSSGSQGTTLKEHDLLGLSDVSSTNASRQDNSPARSGFPHEGLNLNLNLGATELRLGLQDEKQNSGFQYSSSGPAAAPENGAPAALETGSFLGLDAGGKGTELDGSASDRRSSNIDHKVANSEQQQQDKGTDRGFSYSSLHGDRASQGGRVEKLEGSACRPLIESESLKKWHGAADRKPTNESFSLNMSLQQQQQQQQNMTATPQEDLTEKKVFHNSADRDYNEKPQEVMVGLQQQQSEWQEQKQHNTSQDDDVSSSEKGLAQDQVMLEKTKPLELQQAGETRNLSDGKAMAALQPPEQRFPQDLSTVPSPRHADYLQQKLWQSQMLMRSQICAPEFQTQQQQVSLPPQDERSHNGSFQGPRGVFPASKPAVSGAKRPFDTIGTGSESRAFNESRVSSVSEAPSMVTANSTPSDADVKSKSQPPYQSWSTRAPTWQMLHSGGSFGPFPSQAPGRNQVMSKNPVEGTTAGGDAAQKAWEAHTKSLQQQDQSTSISQKIGSCATENKPAPAQAPSAPSEAVSAPRAAAPTSHAVGWPPLRSYRKNSIAAHPRPSTVETQTRPPPPAPPQAASPASVASQPNSWFVKVYMDGVPFGRKVDLKTNRSYEKLSLVLEDMFRGFVTGQQSSRDMTLPSDKRNFLHGSDYVLTYEDQDGDLMLVGDVPWTMFIDTVKRLRIMKGSEAIGLGTRAAEKANKMQPTV